MGSFKQTKDDGGWMGAMKRALDAGKSYFGGDKPAANPAPEPSGNPGLYNFKKNAADMVSEKFGGKKKGDK